MADDDAKDLLKNYQHLHRLLWGRNKEIRERLFVERVIEVPKFSTVIPEGARVLVESPDDPGTDGDGEVRGSGDSRTEDNCTGDSCEGDGDTGGEPGEYGYATDPQQKKLAIHATFLSLKEISAEPPTLPCGDHTMYYRDSYRELFEFLMKLVKDEGLAVYNAEKPIVRERKRSRGFIITGQPGIGKTYFGSLLLVERLLRGLPTVLQLGTPEGDTSHLIFSDGGVCGLGDLPQSTSLFRDVTVWVLVDGKPMGGPAYFQHPRYMNWLIVSTTSPRPENTKAMEKALSPLSIYLPTWTWEELVCAV